MRTLFLSTADTGVISVIRLNGNHYSILYVSLEAVALTLYLSWFRNIWDLSDTSFSFPYHS